MKLATFLATTVFGLILTSGAHAQTYPQTHYHTLRQAFHHATIPARTRDFEASNWDRCVYVDMNDQNNLRPTHVRRVTMTTAPRGPMFPGHTEYRVDLFHDRVIDQNLFSYFASSYEIANPEYFFQVVDGPGWLRMNIYGKVDRDILVFHLATSGFSGPQAPMNPQAYGYCWRENSRGSRPPMEPVEPDDDDVPPPPPPAPRPTPRPQRPAPQPAPAPPVGSRPQPPANVPQVPAPQAPAPAPKPMPKPVPAPKPVPNRPTPPPASGDPLPLPPPPPPENN